MTFCFHMFQGIMILFGVVAIAIAIINIVICAKHRELNLAEVKFSGKRILAAMGIFWWTYTCSKGYSPENYWLPTFGLAFGVAFITIGILFSLWKSEYD